jgi:hypothetical protein
MKKVTAHTITAWPTDGAWDKTSQEKTRYR